MARASSIPKPRGFKPYSYREVEETHIEQLRQFLHFIYSDYRDGLRFTADYLPLLYEKPIEEIRKEDPRIVGVFFSDSSLEQCQRYQQKVCEGFKEMVKKARRGAGYDLGREQLNLTLTNRPGVGKVFTIWRWPEPLVTERDDPKHLLKRVGFHLAELRGNALRICKRCEHYFIQGDIRPARFCSQRCRVAAAQRRLRERKLSGRKKR